jgi:hypothetical protein
MSDLLFMGGALTVIAMCIAAMIGMLIYSLVEFTNDKRVPFWAKVALITFTVGFLTTLVGVALKIMENL